MSNKNKGILFILLSAISFSIMGLFVKLAGDVPPMQKSLFRNIISLIVATCVIIRLKSGFNFQKKNLPFLILRATFGTFGILCHYYALSNLILSDANMLAKLAPFFVIIFSFFILKERIKLWHIYSIIIGFIGSLFIINPSIILSIFGSNIPLTTTLKVFPSLIAVLGAIFAGLAYTMLRLLSIRGEKGPFIVFFFSAFSSITILPFVILNFEPMSFIQFIYLLFAGIFASFGQFAVTSAYSNAPSKEISVFDYSQIIFSSIIGYIVFNERPDKSSFIGYAIIISVVILLFNFIYCIRYHIKGYPIFVK